MDRRRFAGGLGLTTAFLACSPSVGYGATDGVLRVAENQFPTTPDADIGFSGYSLMSYGIAEALMRVEPDLMITPWLAEKLEAVDERHWIVTLRPDATFWDGSPVDADAVIASFERSFQEQPATSRALLPDGTVFEGDGLTLHIRTQAPIGRMESILASFYLSIKKVTGDGALLYTGPYTFSDLVERTSVTLHAYPSYRDGAARTGQIDIRYIPDPAARALALQAGDVDLAHALLPSQLPQLESQGFVVDSFPFGRQVDILVNVRRPPLDDVRVRRALSLAIDRDLLNVGILDGQGTPAFGMAPEDIGIAGIVQTQHSAPQEASSLLDEAGWLPGDDGIRSKDGKRLALGLGYYESRPELPPLGIAIQDQLAAVGIEVDLRVYPDINTTVAENDFDLTLYSYGVAPNGDIDRALLALYKPSGTNHDRYSNPEVSGLIDTYMQTRDPEARLDLFASIQTLIGEDVPVIYVVNPYQHVARRAEVTGFTPHPLENYKIDTKIGVEVAS